MTLHESILMAFPVAIFIASAVYSIRATRRRRRCEARIVDYYTMAVAKEIQAWRDN